MASVRSGEWGNLKSWSHSNLSVPVLWLMVKEAPEGSGHIYWGGGGVLLDGGAAESRKESPIGVSKKYPVQFWRTVKDYKCYPAALPASAITGCACGMCDNNQYLAGVSMPCQSQKGWWVGPQFCLDWHLFTQLAAYPPPNTVKCRAVNRVFSEAMCTFHSLPSMYAGFQEATTDKEYW